MNERIIHPALRELAKTYQQLIDVLDGISPPGAVMIVERPRRPTPKPEPERPSPERGQRTFAEVSFGASVSGPVSRRPWSPAKRRRHGAAMRAAWARRRAK